MQSNLTITAQLTIQGKGRACLNFKITHPEANTFMVFEFPVTNVELPQWVSFAKKERKTGVMISSTNNISVSWMDEYVSFTLKNWDNASLMIKCDVPRAQVEEALRLEFMDAVHSGYVSFLI